MQLVHTRILTKLMVGFTLVLMVVGTLGMDAIFNLNRMADLSEQLYRHPFHVSNAIRGVKHDVLSMHLTLTDAVDTEGPGETRALEKHFEATLASAYAHLDVVRTRYLGPGAQVDEIARRLGELTLHRRETFRLLSADAKLEADQRVKTEDHRQTEILNAKVDEVLHFALNKAREFYENAQSVHQGLVWRMELLLLGALALSLTIALVLARTLVRPLESLRRVMQRLAEGDLDIEVPFQDRRNELGAMARTVRVFQDASRRIAAQHWVKTNISRMANRLQVAETLMALAQTAISELTPALDAGHGAFYLYDEGTDCFVLLGGYACGHHKSPRNAFARGEGLVGQCAQEKAAILLKAVPPEYVTIHSGLGDAAPRCILVVPVLLRDRVIAVIEIAAFAPFSEAQQTLLDEALPVIALNLELLDRNLKTQDLLAQTQAQAEALQHQQEELQSQSEELEDANHILSEKSEALESQTQRLLASEEELQAQSEELRAANEELRVTNEELAQKSYALEERQKALLIARRETEQRALEVELASRAKSEFLANMSHELRTPLNSLLILAKCLADNDEGNLTGDQVESARIVHESGTHLLHLINDILDLSKIESGKMQVMAEDLAPLELARATERQFRRLAEARQLTFTVETAPDLPALLHSDRGKIVQIINNLVGNAIKFTETGGVTVHFLPWPEHAEGGIRISVTDTGIGIPADKYDRIFKAFEQVDGTTSRRFGGTGLGLTIARRLAELLGGSIALVSTPGQGSTFTLSLPRVAPANMDETGTGTGTGTETGPAEQLSGVSSRPLPAFPSLAGPLTGPEASATGPTVPSAATASTTFSPAPASRALPAPLDDDRSHLRPGDRVVLIIEDDPVFTRTLIDLARRKGFKAVVAAHGEAGLALADTLKPAGIVLDIGLPGMDGWAVITRLKSQPDTRNIPVHVISASDDGVRGLDLGAVGFLAKPVTREQINDTLERIATLAGDRKRRLLVVDDDANARHLVTTLIAEADPQVDCVDVATGTEALARLAQEHFDCMVLDLGLPDMDGIELLETLERQPPPTRPAVVIYSGRDLSRDETARLRQHTDSIVIKGVRSQERLLEEVHLFLHSVTAHSQDAIATPRPPASPDETLTSRSVLVVDDDMRNAFALSKVLSAHGLSVLIAQDGHKALAQLERRPDLDIVLMDIMMPGIDGYQTIQEIRRQPRFAKLPILALTAKAMPGDRARCLEAGANDYLSKPVDIDRLLSMIRVWLPASRPPVDMPPPPPATTTA